MDLGFDVKTCHPAIDILDKEIVSDLTRQSYEGIVAILKKEIGITNLNDTRTFTSDKGIGYPFIDVFFMDTGNIDNYDDFVACYFLNDFSKLVVQVAISSFLVEGRQGITKDSHNVSIGSYNNLVKLTNGFDVLKYAIVDTFDEINIEDQYELTFKEVDVRVRNPLDILTTFGRKKKVIMSALVVTILFDFDEPYAVGGVLYEKARKEFEKVTKKT